MICSQIQKVPRRRMQALMRTYMKAMHVQVF